MAPVVRSIPLQKLLLAVGSPFDVPIWRGLYDPITHDEIDDAIAEGLLNEPIFASESQPYPREWHIERIAWFVENGWSQPIELDLNALWPVVDGNHRFAAAIHRGDSTLRFCLASDEGLPAWAQELLSACSVAHP